MSFLRSVPPRIGVGILSLVMALIFMTSAPAQQAHVDAWVLRNTEHGAAAEFLVLLRDQADLSAASKLATKLQKGQFVYDTLFQLAQRTQKPVIAFLNAHHVEHRSFYIVNGLWVRGTRQTVEALAERPDVWRIEGNPTVNGLLRDAVVPMAPAMGSLAVEPGILYTNAPSVWAMGYTGQGVVVGGQDTGYQWDHPALIGQYRGSTGGAVNHDYNWHDSIHSGGGSCGADQAAPCDDNNHGTHTMGTAIGDDGFGNQVGMAPGSQWIGSRNMDQGNGTPATYLESFEFFLAPYPVSGTPAQGLPAMSPDVTTNSWTCPPSEGCALTTLQMAVIAQRAAGIVTVCAAGNSGSNCSTVSDPPSVYDEVYSVGAHRYTNGNIASFSSRGPATVNGITFTKPDLAAPGVSVRSSVPNSTYAGGWNGTSMATPHVAGAIALLFSAHPALKGQVDATEAVLNATAVGVASTDCASSGIPNNVYGHGRLDVLAAVNAVRGVSATPSTQSVSGAAGTLVTAAVSVTNTGYLSDTFGVSVTGGTFAHAGPSTIGPVPAGQTATLNVVIFLPAGASTGTSSSLNVLVSSMNWASAASSVSITATVSEGAPQILFSQSGPAAPLLIGNADLLVGREYFNIFSLEPCAAGVGTGPFLGLCATDPSSLLSQFALPLGVEPVHFAATSTTSAFGPYPVPAGLVIEAICFDFTAGILGGISNATRYVVQ